MVAGIPHPLSAEGEADRGAPVHQLLGGHHAFEALDHVGVAIQVLLDLGHVGIFQALVEAAGLPQEAEENLLSLLQAKDVPALSDLIRAAPDETRKALEGFEARMAALLPAKEGG